MDYKDVFVIANVIHFIYTCLETDGNRQKFLKVGMPVLGILVPLVWMLAEVKAGIKGHEIQLILALLEIILTTAALLVLIFNTTKRQQLATFVIWFCVSLTMYAIFFAIGSGEKMFGNKVDASAISQMLLFYGAVPSIIWIWKTYQESKKRAPSGDILLQEVN